MPQIRPAHAQDHAALLSLWLDSVRATHRFLSEAEIQELLPVVRDAALPQLELWVLEDEALGLVGFMGLDGASVEALFLAPAYFRRGGGRLLLAHARVLKGRLSLSVNEQNPGALAFYEANGFRLVSRSPLDGQGRPYPLLHLREPEAGAARTRLASCSCGQLSATVSGGPLRVSVCHCLACQRRTGSAFGAQARFAREQVSFAGQSQDFVRVGDEGGRCTFSFCPNCGATVHYTMAGQDEWVAIPVGAFADPTFPAPSVSVYEERQHRWVGLPDGIEHIH